MNRETRQSIASLLFKNKDFYESNARYAAVLGINTAQLSRLLNGDTEGVLAERKWINIANRYDLLTSAWQPARTQVYIYITTQLEDCHKNKRCALLCDEAGIGKSYTARYYCLTHANAIYIDCSQSQTKRKLICAIGRELGVVSDNKTFADYYEEVKYRLSTMPSPPLIVLDEFGDLRREAIMEVKALWNSTAGLCGWYIMGANGLRALFERGVRNNVLGFAELFSRFGGEYGRVTPEGEKERNTYMLKDCVQIIRVNDPHCNAKEVAIRCDCEPRRVYNILKIA